MSADGTISEHSPQSVPWHQVSRKSRNYQTGFGPLHEEISTTTPNSWPKDDKDGRLISSIKGDQSSEERTSKIRESTHLSPFSSPLKQIKVVLGIAEGIQDYGGYGTLEELLEVITWAQLGIHDKPVGLLNVDGFYNYLLTFIDKAVDDGFIKPCQRNIFVSAPNDKELVQKLEEYGPVQDEDK
ncbi:hypothetical protein ACS0TY_016463 [Phlomoides rotata]